MADEEIFLANYSDGLTDAPLPDMIDRFKSSGKIGCFIAVHPPFSFHLAEFDEERNAVQRIFARANNPRFGSMADISFFATRFSITFEKARSWCLSRSTA